LIERGHLYKFNKFARGECELALKAVRDLALVVGEKFPLFVIAESMEILRSGNALMNPNPASVSAVRPTLAAASLILSELSGAKKAATDAGS